ncbi:putative NBD/HSP70 family sugar kinase [Virgibacillus halotolerans]|uniref:ROK family transcriptional regulator n=1 Tax=Virgibacillus halotolerans TaxID=1071053 RepID=UPI001960DD85|nr:ROK family transcriptional regulator [Virgibacillus halotolerans]MBM7599039.1 putative NBD/HSP70 family sugar kinase [Virgibacillus halotolerans]
MTVNLKYDQKNVREYHYFLLLNLIQKHKQISRSQLASLTMISNTTVGKIVKQLIEDKLIVEVGQREGDVGRRATILEINPKGAYIIGVDIDLNTIKIAYVTLDGMVIKKQNFNFDVQQPAEFVLDKIATGITSLVSDMSVADAEKILAVGISIPGLVSWPDGKILTVPQFSWNNIPIKEYLKKELGFHVYVDNHVRAELLAESLFGSMVEYSDAVCLYIGSGVGSAIMVNNEILRGQRNTLGEIGHMTLDPNGALCDCGRLGCLQTFLCSSEIEKQTMRSIDEVSWAYEEGKDWAVKIIGRAKSYLGLAISNIICMYNPSAVLLAGPMIEQFPILVEDLGDLSNDLVWTPLRDSFQLVLPDIGKDSGVVGASALVLNEFLR